MFVCMTFSRDLQLGFLTWGEWTDFSLRELRHIENSIQGLLMCISLGEKSHNFVMSSKLPIQKKVKDQQLRRHSLKLSLLSFFSSFLAAVDKRGSRGQGVLCLEPHIPGKECEVLRV